MDRQNIYLIPDKYIPNTSNMSSVFLFNSSSSINTKLNAVKNFPIDHLRYYRWDQTERNQLIVDKRAYPGLQVYEGSTGKLYLLQTQLDDIISVNDIEEAESVSIWDEININTFLQATTLGEKRSKTVIFEGGDGINIIESGNADESTFTISTDIIDNDTITTIQIPGGDALTGSTILSGGTNITITENNGIFTFNTVDSLNDFPEWQTNSLNTSGYVTAPTIANKNKVWATDDEGNPSWLTVETSDTVTELRVNTSTYRTGQITLQEGTDITITDTDGTFTINSTDTVTTIQNGTGGTPNSGTISLIPGTNISITGDGGSYTFSTSVTTDDDILKGETNNGNVKYSPYTTNESTSVTPKFYTHATNPTGTSRLNVSAEFYATKLYSGGNEVLTDLPEHIHFELYGSNDLVTLSTTSVTNAVNNLHVTNSVTSYPVLLETTGTDTDIDLNIKTKGNSKVLINSNRFAIGSEASPRLHGELSISNGNFSGSANSSQFRQFILRNITSDNSPALLYLDGISELLTLPDTIYTISFRIQVSVSKNDGRSGSFFFDGLIRRLSDNTVEFVGEPNKITYIETDLIGIECDIIANNTNNRLDIQVKGLNSTTIRWSSMIDILQITWGTNW